MKARFNIILVAVALLTLLPLAGCNTNGCTDNRSAIPLAEFYAAGIGKVVMVDSVQINGIGAPGDSILMTAATKTSQVYLPMRATASQVRWRFDYKWTYAPPADTLTIDYTPMPWFASEECGAMYKYRIRRVAYTINVIDSVGVVDSMVTNTDMVRLHIYLKTEPEPEPER